MRVIIVDMTPVMFQCCFITSSLPSTCPAPALPFVQHIWLGFLDASDHSLLHLLVHHPGEAGGCLHAVWAVYRVMCHLESVELYRNGTWDLVRSLVCPNFRPPQDLVRSFLCNKFCPQSVRV